MYQAVFIDIDKTLLNSYGQITKETEFAIQEAKKNGISIFLVSGRSRAAARKYQEFSSGYLISSNGADIYDWKQEKVFCQSVVETSICKMLYEFAERENVIIKFDFGISRAGNKAEYLEDYEVEIPQNVEQFLAENKVVQVAMCSEDLHQMEEVKEYVHRNTKYRVINQFIWEVNGKVMHAIHITNPNVSKGSAMKTLCQYLNIDLKETVAIGDKINDISMIELAGFGVAMENATPNVKEVADFITSSNNENGVACVLKKVVEMKKLVLQIK